MNKELVEYGIINSSLMALDNGGVPTVEIVNQIGAGKFHRLSIEERRKLVNEVCTRVIKTPLPPL